jgi:cytochrome b561
MRRLRAHPGWLALFFAYFFAVTIQSAHAYIDPGTGSYVFQVLVGALLGAAVAVKLFWRRIWRFITRRPADRPADEPVARDE